MGANRRILNWSYALLALWLLFYWVCSKYFIIFLPPVFIFYYGSFIAFFLMSFSLWENSTRLISESRIVACLLLLPFLWSTIGHRLFDEAKLRWLPPSEASVRAFIFHGAHNGIQEENIDLMQPIVVYHHSNKQLDLHIRIRNEFIVTYLGHEEFHVHNSHDPEAFIEEIRRYFVFPEGMASNTLVPKRITLYGYLNDTLVFENHFSLVNGEYKMEPPSSPLYLISEDGSWYWEYEVNGRSLRIFISADEDTEDFKRSIWDSY